MTARGFVIAAAHRFDAGTSYLTAQALERERDGFIDWDWMDDPSADDRVRDPALLSHFRPRLLVMATEEEAQAVLRKVRRYVRLRQKRGFMGRVGFKWPFRVLPKPEIIDWSALVPRLTFRTILPVRLHVAPPREGDDRPRLVVTLRVESIHGGAPTTLTSRYPLPPERDALAAIRLVRTLVLRAIEHEIDECLLVDGRQLADPHANGRPGRRLVDHGITALLDDPAALADLTRSIARLEPPPRRRSEPAAEDHA